MSKQKQDVYVIQHKETGQHFVARSGKSSWKNKAAAKNAWANTYHDRRWYRSKDEVVRACEDAKVDPVVDGKGSRERTEGLSFPYFDEQDQWVLTELLGDTSIKLHTAQKLLEQTLQYLPYKHDEWNLADDIKEFLNE